MAQPYDELLDHEYDGIREYNNPLPRWWQWLFYLTILFSVGYIPYYLFDLGPSSAEMYAHEVQEAQARYPRLAAAAPQPSAPGAPAPAESAPAGIADPSVVGNAEAIAAGKATFGGACLPCHGDKGQGLIGPNLTDRYWLHGNTFADIVNTIANGVPDKGMIPWKSTLNPRKINEVAAFVMSLRGTRPDNAKAPQGQEYPE